MPFAFLRRASLVFGLAVVIAFGPSCSSSSTYALKLADGRELRSYEKPEWNEHTRYYRLTDSDGRYVLIMDTDVLSIEREVRPG